MLQESEHFTHSLVTLTAGGGHRAAPDSLPTSSTTQTQNLIQMEREINIAQVRESISELLAMKVKKTYVPFQTLGRKLLNLSDAELTQWCKANGCPTNFMEHALNSGVAKAEKAKYARLCLKVEDGEELTEAETEFAEEYEANNGIEDTIV